MAAAFLLVLVAVGAAQATVPDPCQGGPVSWCQDMATATQCGQEEYCRDFWDSLAMKGDTAKGHVAEGDVFAPGRRKKCSLCTNILKQVKAMVGDDPDEATVEAALGKACQALGKRLGRVCKQLVKKYREEISEALQNGDDPQDTCAAIGFCKA